MRIRNKDREFNKHQTIMELLTFIFSIALAIELGIAIWFNTESDQKWINNL